MTDGEFLSLVPGVIIYHVKIQGREATVETSPVPRERKIWSFGKPKLTELVVQIMMSTGRRILLRGGSEQTREWCLNLEETIDGPRRAQAARLSAQRRKKEEEEWIKRQPIQQAKRLAERKRAAGPDQDTHNWVCLRFEGKYGTLSKEEAKACITRLGFFDKNWNPAGRFEKEFVSGNGPMTVIERRTGLMWQRGVGLPSVDEASSKKHIDKLNNKRFAGFDDWRIPTLEEAATLLDPPSKASRRHLDPVFGSIHQNAEGAFLRATQSDDIVLSFVSACNERERGPSPPCGIITADASPGWEPYDRRIWRVDFVSGIVTDGYDTAMLLACRSIGVTEK